MMPLLTLFLAAVICVLLSLIVLGSTVAFNDFISLQVAALCASYLITCSLFLWRRLTKGIKVRDDNAKITKPGDLRWGPWRVREPFGTLNNIFAVAYLLLIFFWSFWPPATPVTPQTMNFSVLMLGSVVLFSVLWYWFHARKTFLGPIIEIGALEQ